MFCLDARLGASLGKSSQSLVAVATDHAYSDTIRSFNRKETAHMGGDDPEMLPLSIVCVRQACVGDSRSQASDEHRLSPSRRAHPPITGRARSGRGPGVSGTSVFAIVANRELVKQFIAHTL